MAEQRSVSHDMCVYCHEIGLGVMGTDLFAHDFPDADNFGNVIVFQDTRNGKHNRVLSGESTSQYEYFQVLARSTSEEKARALLLPINTKLDNMLRKDIGGSHYLSIHAVQPIHFVGTDKNKCIICEVDYAVLRRRK